MCKNTYKIITIILYCQVDNPPSFQAMIEGKLTYLAKGKFCQRKTKKINKM